MQFMCKIYITYLAIDGKANLWWMYAKKKNALFDMFIIMLTYGMHLKGLLEMMEKKDWKTLSKGIYRSQSELL